MIKERVIQLIEFKKLKKEDFFVKIGMTSANFRGNAKNTPLNSTAIENILSEIPDVNPEWLLIGKEPMIRQPNINIANNDNTLIDRLMQQAEQIGELKNENKNLEKTVTALQTELECYKKGNTELRGAVDLHTRAAVKVSEPPEVPIQLITEQEVEF